METCREQIKGHCVISASPEVALMLNNLNELKLARNVPSRMKGLLSHLKESIGETMEDIEASGRQIFVAGPQWCKQNIDQAAVAHAKVIVDAYGQSYALPNKNPEANKAALQDGLEMFLMFDDKMGEPLATACMVPDGVGKAELGRAASRGHVGGRLIQDLRILHWLTDAELSKKFHTLFATLRTAPDRNIGGDMPMRGGQAICHIWKDTPGVIIGGFGPLYKKHGELEQFAHAMITQERMTIPGPLFVRHAGTNSRFVRAWLTAHAPDLHTIPQISKSASNLVTVHFPPPESGITKLVHADIEIEENGSGVSLDEAIKTAESVGSPFIQMRVPIDQETDALQGILVDHGFQAFQFTPGLGDKEPPFLWFGKVNGDIPVVPTFWQKDQSIPNPFWRDELAAHAERIANGWNIKN